MDEVGGALVAIALVLISVFVPSAFITGISGQFYRQFALTIAGATVISLTVSLTLSPALCRLLLKPPQETRMLKATCGSCGYVIRTTLKWATRGMPTCHCGTKFALCQRVEK